jgi:RNA polymerase sigma factor (sigma-70 family)
MTRGSRLRPLARAVLRTQSDERLVALSREGREAAFEEIVRRYRPGLVAFAAAYAPAEQAEDVVQESFVRSWDALRSSTEEIRLKPWLYTIVRNRALNARRDARPHAPLSDELDGVREPAEIALTNEELARVVGAVSALPDPQREALVRSAVEGHTHEQIAASIGSSPGAVRQLIYRARLSVREGFGFVIPLPLVRVLAEMGSGEAIASGAVAGGAAVAGTAGGTSVLTKATVAAVVGTIAAASGVAIKRSDDVRGHADSPATAVTAGRDGAPGGEGRGTADVDGEGSSGPSKSAGPGSGGGHGSSDSSGPGPGGEGGDDRSGPGDGSDDADGNSGPSASSGSGSGAADPDEDNSGPGGGGDPREVEDELESDSSGPGSGSSGSGSSGSSGSGSSGSGSSGSGSSGSGSTELEPDDGSSGSSGSSDSGSSSSGSDGELELNADDALELDD